MKINAKDITIKLLLTATKYQLDYYQREYSWQTQHVLELIDDLTSKFLDNYKEGPRTDSGKRLWSLLSWFDYCQ